MIVENIGGGGSSLGAAAVARARPDGYTILLGGTLPHINEALFKSRPLYDPIRDLDPIAGLAVVASALAVHPSVPAQNLKANIGTEAVVRAPADGYTLLVATSANAFNATLYDKLNFNFIRDIAPVAGIIVLPGVMVVNPSVPATTVSEFIAYAKANAGKLNMASGGIGSLGHVSGELFKMMAGINIGHVPYRGGGPALTDLLAGQVQVYFSPLPAAIEYIRAGKLRALAVTTAARSEALPDIATVAGFVPGYEASTWTGVGAPKATPAEIVEKLNKEINAALADPKIKARLADLGGTVLPGTPADFGKLIADETEKWAKVIKSAGIKAE
jgi:tripartite-type tricarboxylate transporter receptor subunit TctC